MKKIVLPVALALMGINVGAYAADVSIDILSATVKDKRIEGASVTLQRMVRNLFLVSQMHRAALVWVLHLLILKMLY